jgi:phosphoribosyl 1,2-cyclic phosphodiesterase
MASEGATRVRVVSLGSGSSGNALLVQAWQTAVLVDAGFPQRLLVGRLRRAGITPGMLSAILLTHEHGDHVSGARELAHAWGVPLVSDPRTLDAIVAGRSATMGAVLPQPERLELPAGRTTRLGGFEIRSFPISHDAVAPCGYVLSTGAWCVAVVTDCGMVSEAMIEALRPAHLLVIEANHDLDMLRRGPYPWHLKQRILSPTGHLSNEQAAEALLHILDDGPRWVWLAHLSRTNNRPELARTHIRERLRAAGLKHILPQSLPPAEGPTWDSAALWAPPQPALPDMAPTAHAAVAAADVALAAEDLTPISIREPRGLPVAD